MQTNVWPTSVDFLRFLPEIILSVMAILIMVLEAAAKPEDSRKQFPVLSIAALLAGITAAILHLNSQGESFGRLLISDYFGTFFRILVMAAAAVVVLASSDYLRKAKQTGGEFHSLLLFAVVGQCLMAASNDLIMIFIGLEISSIASYVLAGYFRDDHRASESALKYFLLGSFATAFLLYGVAWIYGITGSTALPEVRDRLASGQFKDPVWIGAAAALLFVGFAFKVSAAPFQVWAPDVYQGAPAPISAFLTAGPKAAAFAILFRTFHTAFTPLADQWQVPVAVCALLTMIIGNFAALRQHNVKRMLAYSSIAHAGYVMAALASVNQNGVTAAMFYLAAYICMNLGAFIVVTHVVREAERYTNTEDFAGLASKQPMVAAGLTVFMLSLIGVPLTGGFFGKFYIFTSTVDAGLIWLTVLGLLSSAVASYYYLKLVVMMYMREPGASVNSLPAPSTGITLGITVTALATLILGVFPNALLPFLQTGADLLIKSTYAVR
jgi:NADH-quinone oxidoreductase subunit N